MSLIWSWNEPYVTFVWGSNQLQVRLTCSSFPFAFIADSVVSVFIYLVVFSFHIYLIDL